MVPVSSALANVSGQNAGMVENEEPEFRAALYLLTTAAELSEKPEGPARNSECRQPSAGNRSGDWSDSCQCHVSQPDRSDG